LHKCIHNCNTTSDCVKARFVKAGDCERKRRRRRLSHATCKARPPHPAPSPHPPQPPQTERPGISNTCVGVVGGLPRGVAAQGRARKVLRQQERTPSVSREGHRSHNHQDGGKGYAGSRKHTGVAWQWVCVSAPQGESVGRAAAGARDGGGGGRTWGMICVRQTYIYILFHSKTISTRTLLSRRGLVCVDGLATWYMTCIHDSATVHHQQYDVRTTYSQAHQEIIKTH